MELLFTFLIAAVLILFAAICSGLNISLMAIDKDDLKRRAKLGNKYARRVLPLRQNTHLTLASLLIVNVAAASATALVLGSIFNGWIAGIISTLLLVIFAEILPQALFAKNVLFWTGFLSPLLKLMTIIAWPLSKPLQILLDKLVGQADKRLHTRRELGLMITEHLDAATSELDEDEVEIIQGALELSETRISKIFTPIKDVFWLTPDTELTTSTINKITEKLYSRVPVFNRQLTRCFGVLLLKDLVNVDLQTKQHRVNDFTLHPTESIGDRTALDTALRKFIKDHNHMVPVTRQKKIVGIVTIEDIIEEIVGQEIIDETDLKKKRS